MAKQSGLGDNFYVAQFNLSGDIGSLGSLSTPTGTLESTAINKFAMERLYAHRDGHLEATTYFNPASSQEHEALKSLPTTDRVFSYFRGTTIGNPAFSMVAKQIDYNGNRGDDGSYTLTFTAEANAFGADWGRQLTGGVRTDTTATNGASVDFLSGSTAFGLQAYLHVFAFTGTSATVKIQESSDGGGGDAFVDVTGGSFTTVTGVTSERIQTSRSQTVERYLRVVTTGTFSNLQFAVVVNRNTAAVSY